MGPGVAILLSELIKIGLSRIEAQGKFNTLTEEEARTEAAKIGATLQTILPSFSEIQAGQE